jgi:hypothetical protein
MLMKGRVLTPRDTKTQLCSKIMSENSARVIKTQTTRYKP